MGGFSIMQFYWDGGLFMHPILAVMVISSVFCVKQYLNLSFNFTVNAKFFGKIKTLVKDGRIQEAYQSCLTTSHPLSKVLAAILYNSNKGKDAIESASNIEIQKVLPYIQSGTNYINMCANIATLLGLLGTIQGLIQSFTSLNGASGAEKSAILAQGISTAMNTTAFGLVVAIPCVILYTYLTNKEESILKKYDETISEVTHLVVFKPHAETVNEDPNHKEYRRYGT